VLSAGKPQIEGQIKLEVHPVKLHFPSRRPSASLIVASLALFISLGGAGYAAINIPKNSVGTDAIRNNAVRGSKIPVLAVGWRKIQLGAVGIARINSSTVQARVRPTCSGNSAMSAIDQHGNPTCNPTTPKEFGASNPTPTTVPTGNPAVTLTSKSLPSGSSYLVFANPAVDVSGTAPGSQVTISCTLAVSPGDPGSTATRSITFQASSNDHQTGAIPLVVPAPAQASGSTASVTCTKSATSGTPTVTAVTALNALQTASNG
jgi:hypothetical protein